MILVLLGAVYAAAMALLVVLARAAGRSERRAEAMRRAHGIRTDAPARTTAARTSDALPATAAGTIKTPTGSTTVS